MMMRSNPPFNLWAGAPPRQVWHHGSGAFDLVHQKRAFVHWYAGEGMEDLADFEKGLHGSRH